MRLAAAPPADLDPSRFLVLPEHPGREAVRRATWTAVCDQPLQDDQRLAVQILPGQQGQAFLGFGGAVSELGWLALQRLPEAEREGFFAEVFGDQGLGFRWLRVPIGASDFACEAYSHHEVADEWDLASFSIARDERAVLPFIRAAKRVQPALRLHASPWSPPAWMKRSGRMDGVEGAEIRDEPRVLAAYAVYLRRFCQAYAALGLPIDRLMVQNEMDSASAFPTCRWSPELFVRFHRDHLLPEFERHGLATEVWAGTFRSITGMQAQACFAQPGFRDLVQGAAFQYHLSDALKELRLANPGLRLMHTEAVCHRGENTLAEALSQYDDVLACVDAGAEVFTCWNLVLDQRATSSWGWRQNSLATVTDQGRLRWNPEHTVFGALARVLRPGTRRVASFCRLARCLCLRRGDDELALTLHNPEGPRPLDLDCGGRKLVFDLPGQAICTIRIPAEEAPSCALPA